MATQRPSRADRLKAQWLDFRKCGSIMYDVLLWQDLTWPALSLAWLPQSVWKPPPAIGAAESAASHARQRDFNAAEAALQQHKTHTHNHDRAEDLEVDSPAAATAGGKQQTQAHAQAQPQLVPMPVEFHYLLTGNQTSGRETAYLDLYRVEVPGQERFAVHLSQQVLMQKADMRLVMHIPHGTLDVNRVAIMPQDPNIVCTACDAPDVYMFDLRQHEVTQQQNPGAGAQGGTDDGGAASGDEEDRLGSSRTTTSAGQGEGCDVDDTSSGNEASSSSASAGVAALPHAQAVLVGRTAGGFGLEFNPVKDGLLLGGDSDGGVQLWDVDNTAGSLYCSNSTVPQVQPMQAAHNFAPCAINDVSWHHQGSAYALATEQGQVWVQDLRAPLGSPSSSSRSQHALTGFTGPAAQQPSRAQVHVRRHRKQQQDDEQLRQAPAVQQQDCFCVAFDPMHDYRLASGGADGFVNILDLRQLDQHVDRLGMHAGSVTSIAWSHSLPGLLASTGEDGAVLLWDANKLQHAAVFQPQQQQRGGQEGLRLPQPCEVQHLSQELRGLSQRGMLFMHGGHMGPVGALALNPDRPWLMASSTENVVQGVGADGRNVVVQRQPVMVWEVNHSHGLLPTGGR